MEIKVVRLAILPVDYFGVVGEGTLKALTNPEGDKRKRKTALNSLGSLVKMANLINPAMEEISGGGIHINAAGERQIFLEVSQKKMKGTVEVPLPRVFTPQAE